MSGTECGLNGAIYLVEMDPKGDKGVGTNEAGAEYGTGYCDAQCPRDLKWIKGKANIKPKWVPNEKDPMKNIGEGGESSAAQNWICGKPTCTPCKWLCTRWRARTRRPSAIWKTSAD